MGFSILLQTHQVLDQILHQLILLYHVPLERKHLTNDTLILLCECQDVVLHVVLYGCKIGHLCSEISIRFGGPVSSGFDRQWY